MRALLGFRKAQSKRSEFVYGHCSLQVLTMITELHSAVHKYMSSTRVAAVC